MSPTDRAKGTSKPQPGPAPAVEATPSSIESADGGEFTAAPWLGMHYASEGS